MKKIDGMNEVKENAEIFNKVQNEESVEMIFDEENTVEKIKEDKEEINKKKEIWTKYDSAQVVILFAMNTCMVIIHSYFKMLWISELTMIIGLVVCIVFWMTLFNFVEGRRKEVLKEMRNCGYED